MAAQWGKEADTISERHKKVSFFLIIFFSIVKINIGAIMSVKSIGPVILFFSLAESLTLPRAPQPEDYLNVTQKFLESNIRDVTTVAFVQFVQKATYEEITGLVKQMIQYRDKCMADMQQPECSQLAIYVMQDIICGVKELSDKYGLSECCTKDTSDRRLCFFQYKSADVNFLAPFQVPDPEKVCQEYAEDQEAFLNQYIYEIVRQNPFGFAPTLLSAAATYKEVISRCCQEKNKRECFHLKAMPITNGLKERTAYQKNTCGVLMKHGPKVLKFLKVVEFSQKFPKIDFKELGILLEDMNFLFDECCEGDVVQCFRNEAKIINYICSKPDSISSKIRDCCQLTIPQRGECIINSENDDKPKDLSPRAERFTEGDDVCQRLHEDKENFQTEFLYEYSRRHPELPFSVHLRIGVMYENLLERCCKTENPKECYGQAEEEFQKVTAKSQDLIKTECGYFQNLGEEGFLNQCLLSITKKAPQLPHQELISHSKKLASSFAKCCPLGEEEQFACVDNMVSLTIGEICGINKNRTINPGVDNCCKSSYAFSPMCFKDLTTDETYTSSAFLPELFTFDLTLCQEKEEQQNKRRELIVHLLQQKPLLGVEQVMQLLSDFSKMINCCEVEERGTCFKEEHSKLYNKIETVLRT
ncbi:afamin [Gracilinanus agilis]|uniref:afamin n=1 Tax=Gracilinanus agilis TaxID=191870 RepID=UPI001CFEDBFB|nr:afamin [Gracilinanus agilis]